MSHGCGLVLNKAGIDTLIVGAEIVEVREIHLDEERMMKMTNKYPDVTDFTGIYIRVTRGSKSVNVDIFDATKEELAHWISESYAKDPEFLVRLISYVEDQFNRVFCGKNPTKEQAEVIATVGLEFILSLRHILDSNEVQIVHKDTI